MNKFKDKGTNNAAAVASKRKILEEMEEDLERYQPPNAEKTLDFEFPDVGTLEDYICKMENVSFKYENMANNLLNNISFQVDMDSRIGMIGANGIGKSTLVKLMLGIIKPNSGDCQVNRQARIALFTQYHMDQLNLELSAVDFICQRFAEDEELKKEKDKEQYVRRRLGRFNLTGKQHTQQMKYLSGGQKSRVAFCVATWTKPHFLIMDEPTNHLDMETIDSLANAIEKFHGGVLIVSHDQYFLNKIAKQYWAVTNVGIKIFEDFEKAKTFALKERKQAVHKQISENKDENESQDEKEQEKQKDKKKKDEKKKNEKEKKKNEKKKKTDDSDNDDDNQNDDKKKSKKNIKSHDNNQKNTKEKDEKNENQEQPESEKPKQKPKKETTSKQKNEEKKKNTKDSNKPKAPVSEPKPKQNKAYDDY